MTTGPDFYDEEGVFTLYMQHRQQRQDNPNDTLEKPVIDALIGEPAGLRILDLGCGDARFGRELLDRGARSYLGIEGSQRMLAAAQQTLAGTSGEVIHSTVEGWDYPEMAFELVTARLVLHYIEAYDHLLSQVYRSLVPGGRFIFSIEHPVITSCHRGWSQAAPRQDWLVDDYFETGLRVTPWIGSEVHKYHRTIEDYFSGLQTAGFEVESLRESHPRREHFLDETIYQRRKRIPLFLFLAGRKPED
jgi:SAM-dependent methyltransferase